jgi:hypothetical protein
LTLGFYETFPENIHHIENYLSFVSIRQLQQRLIQFLSEINRQEFNFEEVSIPTVPEGVVIFEFGLAEDTSFTYINPEETNRALDFFAKEHVQALDFFCSIRYYRGNGEKRTALKFDYYMLRTIYAKGTLEMRVFHERGPRYLSPEDLTGFIFRGINGESARKILRETNP